MFEYVNFFRVLQHTKRRKEQRIKKKERKKKEEKKKISIYGNLNKKC